MNAIGTEIIIFNLFDFMRKDNPKKDAANTEGFIKQKGGRTDPDLWVNPENKSEKTLVKL